MHDLVRRNVDNADKETGAGRFMILFPFSEMCVNGNMVQVAEAICPGYDLGIDDKDSLMTGKPPKGRRVFPDEFADGVLQKSKRRRR